MHDMEVQHAAQITALEAQLRQGGGGGGRCVWCTAGAAPPASLGWVTTRK